MSKKGRIKGTRLQRVHVKVYRPGLNTIGFQVIPLDDLDGFQKLGFRLAPTFPQSDVCVICGSSEELVLVAEVESWSNAMYADLLPRDHVCEPCVVDLTMPHFEASEVEDDDEEDDTQ